MLLLSRSSVVFFFLRLLAASPGLVGLAALPRAPKSSDPPADGGLSLMACSGQGRECHITVITGVSLTSMSSSSSFKQG